MISGVLNMAGLSASSKNMIQEFGICVSAAIDKDDLWLGVKGNTRLEIAGFSAKPV